MVTWTLAECSPSAQGRDTAALAGWILDTKCVGPRSRHSCRGTAAAPAECLGYFKLPEMAKQQVVPGLTKEVPGLKYKNNAQTKTWTWFPGGHQLKYGHGEIM